MKPRQHLFHRPRDTAIGQGGPVDHDDRQAQFPRGVDLGARAVSTRVLGDDMGDAVIAQQRQILGQTEGTARDDGMGIWQGQSVRLIHQPQQVMVLGRTCELVQMHPANRQKHPRGGIRQGRRRPFNIGHPQPVIARSLNPRLTLQRDQRHAGQGGSLNGIAAHLGGKGVGGIDQPRETFGLQIARQAVYTTKPAHPHGNRLRARCGNPPRIGQHRILPIQSTCKRAGIGGATQNQGFDGGCHGK